MWEYIIELFNKRHIDYTFIDSIVLVMLVLISLFLLIFILFVICELIEKIDSWKRKRRCKK